ncbi:hypothetical protein Dimus_023429 [Dionaea muscipula]
MKFLLQLLQVPMEIFKVFSFTLLLLVPVLFPSEAVVVVVHGADVFTEALLNIKSQVIDHTNSLTDWSTLPSSEPNSPHKIHACSWSGVTCNTNSTIVVSLDLSRRHLSGEIAGAQFNVLQDLVSLNLSYNSFTGQLPASIFNLNNLRTLDISRNSFSGHFPNGSSGLKRLALLDAFSNSFSGPLPAELSQIVSLVVLNLAGSYFSGPIPSEFGSLKSIEFIHLAGNLLNGTIPVELGKLQTLTHMEIGYNSYQGGIPWQLGNMSELQYLDVAGASLSGPIPKELGNLTKLESLFLFRNHLSGVFPSELRKIVSLSSLDLSDNLISGPIPDSIAELKSLSLLSLMYNDMSGSVPPGIAELPMLETLLIWSNSFSGPLPSSLGSNSKLKMVDVSTNHFNGSIPPNICAGGVLSKLIFFTNNFSGGLPSSLSNCSSLVRIRVEDNSLSGHIPLRFSSLGDISYIDLSRNKFTGGIPSDMSRVSKLEYFNVSYNPELGGYIPPDLWSLPLLENFSASSCNITANLPSFTSCKSISVIELSSNTLTGTIPESISHCLSLDKIDLSNNFFTGRIPEGLSTLPALRFLDLSFNNLSGLIPNNFGNSSSSFKLLNVSFNDLSGPIPQKKVFRLMNSSAFEGNPRLCGVPLQQPCLEKTTRDEELMWVLLLCAAVIVFVSLAIYGLFYLQRRRRKGKWRMVWFSGLTQFTADDVLIKSLDLDLAEAMSQLSAPSHKVVVLPTGLTVSAKKIEWESHNIRIMTEFISQMGNARHRNLATLLGYCYNRHVACLFYDYLPGGSLAEKIEVKRDWASNCRLIVGIAKGLKFLHHECYPAIPHGDLKTSNILFDDNLEPRLAGFGFKFLTQVNNRSSLSSRIPLQQHAGDVSAATKDELLDADIINFGKVILEILTNGRMSTVAKSMQNKTMEVLAAEIHRENKAVGSHDSLYEEIKLVLEVAFLCTGSSRPTDHNRPSLEDVWRILSMLKPSLHS